MIRAAKATAAKQSAKPAGKKVAKEDSQQQPAQQEEEAPQHAQDIEMVQAIVATAIRESRAVRR